MLAAMAGLLAAGCASQAAPRTLEAGPVLILPPQADLYERRLGGVRARHGAWSAQVRVALDLASRRAVEASGRRALTADDPGAVEPLARLAALMIAASLDPAPPLTRRSDALGIGLGPGDERARFALCAVAQGAWPVGVQALAERAARSGFGLHEWPNPTVSAGVFRISDGALVWSAQRSLRAPAAREAGRALSRLLDGAPLADRA